jgi:hypothetical protein
MDASLLSAVDPPTDSVERAMRGEIAKRVQWTNDTAPEHMRVAFSPLLMRDTWAFLCGSLDSNATSANSLKDISGAGAWVPAPKRLVTPIASVCLHTADPTIVVFQFANNGVVVVQCTDQEQRNGLFRKVANECAAPERALFFVVFGGRCVVNKYQINTGKVVGTSSGSDALVRLGAMTICTTYANSGQAIVGIQNTHQQVHATIGNVRGDFDIFWGSGNEN